MAKKLFYKIGEVAEMFNVKTSLIRYWEQEFDFIRPKKTKGGIRKYTQKDIDRFEIIFHLIKEKGMTIQGAKEYMAKKRSQNEMDKLEVINTLKRTRQFLTELKEILEIKEEENLK
jgi:DNA-binding transcriptional MerR regulator